MGTAAGTLTTRVPCRIICVGGDGMFSEILHGLIGRTQRNAGVDQNQPRAALVPSPLRIGIIPAGGVPLPWGSRLSFPSGPFCFWNGDLTPHGGRFPEGQFMNKCLRESGPPSPDVRFHGC